MSDFNLNKKCFKEVIYYDGSKLEIDLKNNQLVSWYDAHDEYEEWFYVNVEEKLLISYLSNESTLKDVLINSNTFSCNRYYDDYSLMKDLTKIDCFDKFLMPTNDSFLGFNYMTTIEK